MQYFLASKRNTGGEDMKEVDLLYLIMAMLNVELENEITINSGELSVKMPNGEDLKIVAQKSVTA